LISMSPEPVSRSLRCASIADQPRLLVGLSHIQP
jgi:hypothetical protein